MVYMSKNRSPWIHQLNRTRPVVQLKHDTEVDVAIVGGGIAGVSSAFFILRDTDKKVIILEASKVAHGATGHNAGQVTSYFERPFDELVQEFGLEKAAEGQRAIELSWELLDQIYTEAELTIPLSRFVGYDGFSTLEQICDHLKKNALRVKAHLPVQMLFISENFDLKNDISAEYKDLYTIVSHKKVLELLETENPDFIAVAEDQKGVINSALFTEEVVAYLLKTYPDRFNVFENTKIQKVVLKKDDAVLDAGQAEVKAKRVLLCTNGFENFEILNFDLAINTEFHHSINGVVARMSGYLENLNKPPMSISYYLKPTAGFDDMEDPYFYLTRRPFDYENNKHNLVCLGGPQHTIPDREEYIFDYEYPDEYQKETDDFLRRLYDVDPNKKIEYVFTWHGLMGYTPNRVRRIGYEPLNPVLLYNLGCNGVGILPSIYGGKRISELLARKELPESIFDPKDQRSI
ncbi:MAG: hypothetical protein JWL80_406 [Parcubacteria group bacterium]|nr:hypothetical protein [Parcubacteria group bacterium]